MSHSPLKVLMVTSSYPRHAQDTASVFLRQMAMALHNAGINVHVLAPADREPSTTNEDGIVVHRFRYFIPRYQRLAYGAGILPNLKRRPVLWLQVPFFLLTMLWATVRLVRAEQPDIIHAHWVLPQGLLTSIVRRYLKTPLIITLHGGDAYALRNPLLVGLKRFSLRRCDLWTSNTPATARAVGTGEGLAAAEIIPMGVDYQRFSSGHGDKLRASLPHTLKIILFVGRLVQKKGVDDLIHAYALLERTAQENSVLWIIGGGDQESRLRQLASVQGLGPDRIRFIGPVPNESLPDYYSAADLFVGPSIMDESGDTEGQGVVFLEAFAAGLCVVATAVGGIPDIISHGHTGILVSPRQPHELASTIGKLLADDGLRLSIGQNAKRAAEQCYAWSHIAQRFKAEYEKIAMRSVPTG
jgi:glycosyltransferase involved in cell wall biosynthesis